MCVRSVSMKSAHKRAHFKARAFSHWARARPACFKGALTVLYHPLSDRHSWLSLPFPSKAIQAHGGGITGSLDWVWMLSDFVRGFPPMAMATAAVFSPLAWVDLLRRRRICFFIFQPFVITRANQASHTSNNTVTNTQRGIKTPRNGAWRKLDL